MSIVEGEPESENGGPCEESNHCYHVEVSNSIGQIWRYNATRDRSGTMEESVRPFTVESSIEYALDD